jgi:hypothetical protein
LQIAATGGTKYSALDWWVPAAYAKPAFLLGLSEVGFDPTAIRVPVPEHTLTATPVGGLNAAHGVTMLGAFTNVAGDALKTLLS